MAYHSYRRAPALDCGAPVARDFDVPRMSSAYSTPALAQAIPGAARLPSNSSTSAPPHPVPARRPGALRSTCPTERPSACKAASHCLLLITTLVFVLVGAILLVPVVRR